MAVGWSQELHGERAKTLRLPRSTSVVVGGRNVAKTATAREMTVKLRAVSEANEGDGFASQEHHHLRLEVMNGSSVFRPKFDLARLIG